MRSCILKSLTLRNFKAVGEVPQTILFQPVTLLFGPNSAGKSTILHALHYGRAVIADRQTDVHQILGGHLDLGGFPNIVHGHDLERTVELSFEFDLNPSITHTPHWLNEDRLQEMLWRPEISSCRVDLEVRWSHLDQRPYVARSRTGINETRFSILESSPDTRQIGISELNFQHMDFFGESRLTPLGEEISEDFEWLLAKLRGTGIEELFPIALTGAGRVGAVPVPDQHLDQQIELGSDGPDDERRSDVRAVVLDILSIGIVLPIWWLRNALDEVLHVGPFRHVPERGRELLVQNTLANWYDGSAAWRALADPGATELVNRWIAGDQGLRTGYRVEIRQFREVPEAHPLSVELLRGDVLDISDELLESFQSLPIRKRVVFQEERTELDLAPADLGVGISQVIPILASGVRPAGVTAIEQPELHLHPAQQVELGDFFILTSSAAGRSPEDLVSASDFLEWTIFLIETHSEHLILRLLRRIRETVGDELQPDMPRVRPNEVAVHWVEPVEGGIRISPLRITEDGEFADRWPRGFFEERVEEVF
jgi:AAA domain/AAA domain, putative AbiEii toxin, Type IV TA system/Protein of unknown function (DUF3696)